LINKLENQLNLIIEGDDKFIAVISNINKRILDMLKPNEYESSTSHDIQHEKHFESLCHALNEHTNTNVKVKSVFEYYTLIEYIKEKNKQNAKGTN
jgi:hypothetical protein